MSNFDPETPIQSWEEVYIIVQQFSKGGIKAQ